MCQDPFHQLFLRIIHSTPKFQNTGVLARHKGNCPYTEDVSSGMFLEVSIRTPGSKRLEPQGHLLSRLIRSPEIIHGSGLLDLVTQQCG